MWRILLLQIQRQFLRHIHTIDYVFIYVLPIFSIGLLNGYLLAIYKSTHDKHDEISMFSVNRTRYLMITDSKDDPIGELRLESWLNAANNHRLSRPRDVLKHNDLSSRIYLWRRNNQIEDFVVHCQTWSVIIINDTQINSGISFKNTVLMFTGMIDSCATDDQYCTVLGHYLEDKASSSLNNIQSFLAQINEDEPFETKHHFDINGRELEFEADIVPAFLASRLCVDIHLPSQKQIPLAPDGFYPYSRIAVKRNDLTRNLWYSSKENSTHPDRIARYDNLLKTLPKIFETSFFWWYT